MFNWIYKHQKFVLSLFISVFFISIIPICIIAGYDCASGDDYNYGSGPHLAYLSTGSVVAAVSAACKTTINNWYGWQGTWFDVFAFCLHPEVFSDSAYVIVPYIFMIMQIAAVCYFSYYFLKESHKIRGRTKQHDNTSDNHSHANNLVDDLDAIGIKLSTNLIYQPRQAPPPKEGTTHDTGKPHEHLERMIRQHKRKLCIHRQKEEDNQWIRERDEEGCPCIIP